LLLESDGHDQPWLHGVPNPGDVQYDFDGEVDDFPAVFDVCGAQEVNLLHLLI
jgi:hypothetical protein